MKTILYLIAGILVFGWAFGYFLGNAGHFIHVLLVLAVIAFLLGIYRKSGME